MVNQSDVDIIIYYPYFDGTSTSLIDVYLNLSKYTSVNCYVVVDTSPENVVRNVNYVKALNASVPLDKFKFEYIELKKLPAWQAENKSRNLIMSFGWFRFISELNFNYDNLVILDAGRLVYDNLVNDRRKTNYACSLPNVKFAGSNVNRQFVNRDTVYQTWHHKFSRERLDFLKSSEVVDDVVDERFRKRGDYFTMSKLRADKLVYQRWNKLPTGIYWENIGKLVFEFAALGKHVHYRPVNKTQDDGLTEYLSLFNINDNVEQDISIGYEELLSTLGMSSDDQLLKLLM